MYIDLPRNIEKCIEKIEYCGYEAYVVGGCVRDSLIGKTPKDWDICTSATPMEIKEIFSEEKTIDIGISHGTVALVLNGEIVEITTFRIDGEYSDSRRPDTVTFTSKLVEDLSRRDFTINAMAYNPRAGIADYFNGKEDLNSGIIRCVGDPEKRFAEDALRIMRALRFMSELNYDIEGKTLIAIENNRGLLKKISAERIVVELNKLIMSDVPSGGIDLIFNLNIMEIVLPEFKEYIAHGESANENVNRCGELIEKCPKNLHLRLTVFFYYFIKNLNVEKRLNMKENNQSKGSISEAILRKLRYDNKAVVHITKLMNYYDIDISPEKRCLKKLLNILGEELLYELIFIQATTIKLSSSESYSESKRHTYYKNIVTILKEIIENNECYNKGTLKLTGKDIVSLGITPGKMVGVILDSLMEEVIDNPKINNKEDLVLRAMEIYKHL